MQYLGGIIDRERYDGFLSKKYDSNEFVAFSTAFNRTKESLQSRFQGLYSQDLKQTFEVNMDENGEEFLPPIGDISRLSEDFKNKCKNLKKLHFPTLPRSQF